ncbi:MAG: peptidase S10 [Candidatus Meridianibacter frigidus]|nr:MAG: peptidase S10 [Candidatus Eremiobacteraeota bacterium]
MKRALPVVLIFVWLLGATPRSAPVPPEKRSVTQHAVSIDGRRIPYTATAATMLLRNEQQSPIASVFYTAYVATGDSSRRPITFCFNGGPGSSSVWLRMGSIGPKRVQTPDAQASAPAPFVLTDNPYSLLDKTDLVFVDAVGTGFSRVAGKGDGKNFWGVDEDVRAFGQFIEQYVSRNARWNSPKFLFGESYGTARAANLVNYLQSRGMSFNGVILLSTVLNFESLIATDGGSDLPYIAFLPTQAATAWYHGKLPNKPADLDAFLRSVRAFAAGPYTQALMKGADLPPAERDAVAQRLHEYTGLSSVYILQSQLRVPPGRFEKELYRNEGQTIGRLDGRFVGYDVDRMGDSADYDPSDVAMSGAFVGAFNDYVRKDLGFKTNLEYFATNYPVVGRAWNWNRGPRSAPVATDVAGDLQNALVKNPHLHVLSANGYFDFATPFFATEYTLNHLDLPSAIRSHIEFTYYQSGHMIYLNTPALAKFRSDLVRFYQEAAP